MQLERLHDATAVAARAADLVAETVRGKPEAVLLPLGPDPARVVTLGATTLAGLAHQFPDDCPRRGLTLGLAEIAAGARIVMLVTGASKAEMLGHLLAGKPTRERPASLLAGHPRFLLLADEAAARHTATTRS